MLPDALIAELQRQNTVLFGCIIALGVAAFAMGALIAWLEAKLEDGCAHCSHCLHEKKRRAERQSRAQNDYEHRIGLHEDGCPCQKGGPPRPRS